MLIRLGYGARGHARGGNDGLRLKQFDFMGALPVEFTYTRAGSQTVRGNTGAWINVAENMPPFDYTASGAALGLRMEPARTNKITQRNFAPIDTTGLSVISGTASVSCVAYTPVSGALIDGSPFTALQNGNVIQITGGASGGIVQISDQVGNTNPHSWRVCLAGADTTYQGNVGMSDGVNIINFQPAQANTFYEIKYENHTPNSAIRYLRISVQANKTLYLIATQLEEGAFLTSPIITTGAQGTRGFPACAALGIDGGAVDWFNTQEGTIIADCVFARLGFDSQYAFLANEGTGLTNSIGLYSNAGSGQIYPRDIIAGANYQIDQVHCPVAGKRMPLAMSWREGGSLAVAGPMRFEQRSRAGSPANMNRIYVGGRAFTNVMCGWVRGLTVMNKYRALTQIAPYMFPQTRTYKAIACGGQSNKHGYFRSQVGTYNGGEAAATAQMDLVWTGSENWMLNGAENGSFLIKQNDPNAENSNANWWYDPTASGDNRWGPRMQDWQAMVTAFGASRIQAIDWDQGESDSNATTSAFKAATLAVLSRIREVIGADIPAFITGIGRRSDIQNAGYNNIRAAQHELAAENSWIHLAPEKFTQSLADTIHLSDAGYAAHGAQHARRMLAVLGESVSGGGTQPPKILSAVRSAQTITVTLSHGAGSDFTPSSGIQGFRFFDNAAEITITSAMRTNATTITLTLASTPVSSQQVLYYGYGSMLEVNANFANLVKDNSPYTLPLQSAKLSV